MKKICWLAAVVIISISCQVQEAEVPVQEEAVPEESFDDAGARERKPSGSPLTLPDGIKPCTDPYVFDLYAPKRTDVGSVTISNDAKNLYVTYFTTKTLQKLFLWVGNTLRDMPQHRGGNPNFQHFFYKAHANNATTYTFTIPLEELAKHNIKCDKDLLAVAYAEVDKEPAFAGNIQLPCFNFWALFLKYKIVCCDEDDGEVEPGPGEETAFAKGNWIFGEGGCGTHNPECLPGLNISNRWGWVLNFDEEVEFSFPVYASAAQNDITKGKQVGNLVVEYATVVQNGSPVAYVTTRYVIDGNWSMKELHIYAADARPTTAAPGRYGHTASFPAGTNTYTFSTSFADPDTANDGVWIIAHAIVKPVSQ